MLPPFITLIFGCFCLRRLFMPPRHDMPCFRRHAPDTPAVSFRRVRCEHALLRYAIDDDMITALYATYATFAAFAVTPFRLIIITRRDYLMPAPCILISPPLGLISPRHFITLLLLRCCFTPPPCRRHAAEMPSFTLHAASDASRLR